ncbi:phosphatase PAP2 family protein [Lyngbya aestuarii]|uniref:phosphatase PAP2 family protein n=1 Tax=Lyngbya aestuarii TaxID=118322 RepID=UPI00403D7637
MSVRFLHSLSKQLVKLWQESVSPKLSTFISAVWIGGLIVAGLALWGFAAIAEEVLEQETQAIDQAILQVFASFHTPLLNQIMVGVTFLGEPLWLTALSVVFGIVLLRQGRWTAVITLIIASGGAIGLNFLLKAVFARSRPTLWQHIVDVNYYSFPSGHAMISLVIYGLIGYWLVTRLKVWQIPIISITVLLIAAIGVSRLYLGVHWPTDIIAGYAAGLVWLVACILGLEATSTIGAKSTKS